MERIPVTPSRIRSVGYDQTSSIIEIAFQSGKIYQYRGVPYRIYVELMSAGSKGSYFDAHIKNAGYNYQRSL
jgi:KTSC domain